MLNLYHTLVLFIMLFSAYGTYADMVSCEAMEKGISVISKDNLFFGKTPPLVIGHRGNPMEYQENTLAGYKSLLGLNVDGFETDIFLTKDNKLVLFHDVNTLKLTGENHQMTEMTYAEIQKLNIKKQLTYGNRIYNYTKTEKIPLLEDLLKEMKDSGLLMILEMKPYYLYNFNHSRNTGVEVAKIVKRMGLEKKVVVSSFDPFKLYHAQKKFNQLNTCFLVGKDYWEIHGNIKYLSKSKADLEHLEDLKDCVKNMSNKDFGRFILETPTVVKAIGASSLDMDYDIFNNPRYSNNTYGMFKMKYGENFSYGAWTVYKMSFNKKELDDSDRKIQNLIENGAGRLYTDDATRLLKKLGRQVRKNSSSLADHIKIPHLVISILLVYYIPQTNR